MPQQECIDVLKQSLPSIAATAGCINEARKHSFSPAGDGETQTPKEKSLRCVFLETKVEYISHTGTAELTFRGLYTRVLVPGVWAWVLLCAVALSLSVSRHQRTVQQNTRILYLGAVDMKRKL